VIEPATARAAIIRNIGRPLSRLTPQANSGRFISVNMIKANGGLFVYGFLFNHLHRPKDRCV
jgi:hypothetical protein